MMPSSFGLSAVAALQEMRERTSAVLSGGVKRDRIALTTRLGELALTAWRLVTRWVWARGNTALRDESRWLVLFSPSRTPRLEGETDYAFFGRIARTNRDLALPQLLGIEPGASVQLLEVRPGLATGPAVTALDYLLAQLSLRDVGGLVVRAVTAPSRITAAVSAQIIELLAQRLERSSTNVVMLTSNSMLAEFIRLAACRVSRALLIEVLHGIASTGMKPYYDFIEASAPGKLRYVNLISGLAHFPSIERHLLQDSEGEIAVNCHIWSRVGPSKMLRLPRELAEQEPLVIVGGTSSAKNYYQTQFFVSECELMTLARQQMPQRRIIYCPHPANPVKNPELVAGLSANAVDLSGLPTFSMLFCATAVVGTYSTSLFEAALLGKRVFLLPFDHSLLMEELLSAVDYAHSAETLEADFRAFVTSLSESPQLAATQRAAAASIERLGLALDLIENGALD